MWKLLWWKPTKNHIELKVREYMLCAFLLSSWPYPFSFFSLRNFELILNDIISPFERPLTLIPVLNIVYFPLNIFFSYLSKYFDLGWAQLLDCVCLVFRCFGVWPTWFVSGSTWFVCVDCVVWIDDWGGEYNGKHHHQHQHHHHHWKEKEEEEEEELRDRERYLYNFY